MIRSFLCGAATLLLGTSLVAQQTLPVHEAVQPKFAGVYKAATGEFLPASQERSISVVIFNNMTLTNYYSVPGANQEWIDDGILNDRNQSPGHGPWFSDQVNAFDFIYCSSDVAPTGTITITYYDENVECAGPVNLVPLCAYAITGLPMGTATGALQCWIVSVDLKGGFECPNNAAQTFRTTEAHPANPLFGWGIIPALNNTGPWIRKGGKGTVNDFTWFDRSVSPPIFVGCFWFGGVPFASFAMKMYGYEPNVICLIDTDTNPNCRWGNNNLDVVNVDITDPGGLGRGIRKGALGRWAVRNPTPTKNYYLLHSPNLGCLSVNSNFGQFTLLLDNSPLPTIIPMPNGVLQANVPSNVPPIIIWTQVICVDGPLNQRNINGISPMYCHCF
jgi:hypothetical protein